MRKRLLPRLLPPLALAAFAMVSAVSAAWAQVEQVFPLTPLAEPAAGIPFDETPQAWFVELKGAPKAKGGLAANLAAERHQFRTEAAELGILIRERYTFEGVFNGLSVVTRLSDVNKIKQLGSVKAVYPVIDIAVPEPQSGENPDLATAISQTQVDIAQNSLGLTGSGIRVAVMDTGIDYDHPDLGGCFGPGCRVEVGYDFVGDAFNNDSSSPGFNPVATPDAFPDDCGGHGTHVSGIVGANGAVKGVAPGVTFGAYRVFGCQGSTSADIMVAAMERILADGADVVNISIGSSFQWPQYPTAQAADRLVENGIVVVASAGNSGANGLYATGAPSVGRNVLAIASFDNSHLRAKGFTVSPDGRQVGYFQAAGAPTAPISGSFPLARTGTATSAADACDPLPAGSLTGKVALIRRGTCGFHIKALNAQNAGAAGVLIYNNVAGLQSITVAGTPAITIPVVSILAAEGVVINNRIAAGPTTLTWADLVVPVPNVSGNLISGFSSYGLNPDARHQARPRRSGRLHLLDDPARAGRPRPQQRHLDGLAACRRRRRPAARGASGPDPGRDPRAAPEQRAAEELERQRRPRLPRPGAPPGRGHAADRRRGPGRRPRHPRQAGDRRVRGRPGHPHADDPQQRRGSGHLQPATPPGPVHGPEHLHGRGAHRLRRGGLQLADGHRAGGRHGDRRRDDHRQRRARRPQPVRRLHPPLAAGRQPGAARAVRRHQGRLPEHPGPHPGRRQRLPVAGQGLRRQPGEAAHRRHLHAAGG